jgi:hypothetical protein
MKYAVEYTDIETGTREIYGDIPRVYVLKADADRVVGYFPIKAGAMTVPVGPALAGKIEAIIAAKM